MVTGWEVWYGFTVLNAQLQNSQARHMWAHGMTGGKGVAGTGTFGYLASGTRRFGNQQYAVGGKAPTDGYDVDEIEGC